MNTKTPELLEDPDYLINKIRAFMEDCRKLLEEGNEVSVVGLDDQVKELCDVLNAMPVREGDKFEPKLQTLIDELDALGNALMAQRDAIRAELAGLNQQQKAATAYQKAATHHPLKPEDGNGE